MGRQGGRGGKVRGDDGTGGQGKAGPSRSRGVGDLADEARITHATPGGQTKRIREMLVRWGVPVNGQGFRSVIGGL
jgi:hypothetical protein